MGASFLPVILIGSLLMTRELMMLLTRPPGLKTRLPWMSWEIGWRISLSVSTTTPFFHSILMWEQRVKRLYSELILHNFVRASTKVCGI